MWKKWLKRKRGGEIQGASSNPDYFLNNLVFIAPAILQSDSIVTLFKMFAVQNVDCSGGIGAAGGVRAGFWSCCRNLVGRLGAASPTLDLHLAPFGARDPKPLSPSFPIMNTLPIRFLEENSLVRRDQMGNDENEIEALPPRLKLLVQYLFSRDIRTHHGQSGNRMGNSGRIWCH